MVLAEIYSLEIKIFHRKNLGLATEDEIQHFSRDRFRKLQFSVSGFVTGKSWLLCFPQAALNLMESHEIENAVIKNGFLKLCLGLAELPSLEIRISHREAKAKLHRVDARNLQGIWKFCFNI